MVSIEITEAGPALDPLDGVPVHPAAELFPLLAGAEFDELVADIAAHGLREPVVMTPDGRLLDGRNRWRACVKAGVTPARRVEAGEPWAYVISTNVHRRHLNEAQRAMIAAKVARRTNGGDRRSADWRTGSSDDELVHPPTQEQVARLLNISSASVSRAKTVRRDGSPALQEAVEQGHVPVYTAARVATSLPEGQQREFVEQVAAGADAKRLAGLMGVEDRPRPCRTPALPDEAPPAPRRDHLSPSRHRHLGVAALRSLSDSLAALDLVVRSTDGLDPAINGEEAARWLGDLSKGRGALSRVISLLKQRKEPNP